MATDFDRTINALDRVYKTLPHKAGTIAVNFFKRRFQEQNWIDTMTKPWKLRQEDRNSRRRNRRMRGILTLTGRLRRSIRKIKVTDEYVLIGPDVPYAKAHNEGFRGVVFVKEHTRKNYKKVKEKYKTRSGRERTRTRRTVDESKDEIKVTRHPRKMRMPQRQFMGRSAVLEKQIVRMIEGEFNRVLK